MMIVVMASHAGTEVVRAEPFDAVEFELGLLWADAQKQA
jgi:hypothetical protein